jgi:hypothetical protein
MYPHKLIFTHTLFILKHHKKCLILEPAALFLSNGCALEVPDKAIAH